MKNSANSDLDAELFNTVDVLTKYHFFLVTIDPHKTGFCQYPAGALTYRNGTMKDFITLKVPDVFHDPDDISVEVYGLEGSKPGAAACGVLLSHQVRMILHII